MPLQTTDAVIIEKEKQLIKDLAGLSSTRAIVLNDRGWDSRVYSFANRYYFKFPRSEKIQRNYKYEISALKSLANLDAGIVAPQIVWEHPENAYFGYKGVPGKPVSDLMGTLSSSHKQAIGEALGTFLKQYHQLHLPGARTMSLEDESKQIQRWYENCITTVHEYFTERDQQKLSMLVYKEWPARLVVLGSELVLCHGDLHFENILYAKNGVVGIIDFGDVAYYDRSKDFLEMEESAEIFSAILSVYGNHDSYLKQKIAVRQAMIQIINLGFHAGKSDRANIILTVEKIKANLLNP